MKKSAPEINNMWNGKGEKKKKKTETVVEEFTHPDRRGKPAKQLNY